MRGCLLKKLILDIFGQGVPFQCRLFCLVQALIFALLSTHCCHCEVSLLLPGGLGRFVPCFIGANHCRRRHIGWRSVVMVSLLSLEKVPLNLS